MEGEGSRREGLSSSGWGKQGPENPAARRVVEAPPIATILTGSPARSLSARWGSLSSTCISSSGTSHPPAPPQAGGKGGSTAMARVPTKNNPVNANLPARRPPNICRRDCRDRSRPRRVPDPVDRPTQLYHEAHHNDDDRYRQGGMFQARPPGPPSNPKPQSSPNDEDELPGKRIEIPDVTLRITRHREVGDLHEKIKEE